MLWYTVGWEVFWSYLWGCKNAIKTWDLTGIFTTSFLEYVRLSWILSWKEFLQGGHISANLKNWTQMTSEWEEKKEVDFPSMAITCFQMTMRKKNAGLFSSALKLIIFMLPSLLHMVKGEGVSVYHLACTTGPISCIHLWHCFVQANPEHQKTTAKDTETTRLNSYTSHLPRYSTKRQGFETNTPWDSYLSMSYKINKATVSLVIRK